MMKHTVANTSKFEPLYMIFFKLVEQCRNLAFIFDPFLFYNCLEYFIYSAYVVHCITLCLWNQSPHLQLKRRGLCLQAHSVNQQNEKQMVQRSKLLQEVSSCAWENCVSINLHFFPLVLGFISVSLSQVLNSEQPPVQIERCSSAVCIQISHNYSKTKDILVLP